MLRQWWARDKYIVGVLGIPLTFQIVCFLQCFMRN